MSKKSDKENLKNPDVFVSTSDKIFNFIEHHFKTSLSIVGVILIVSVSYVTYSFLKSRQEQNAAEALYAPEAALKKAESDIKDEIAKKAQAVLNEKIKGKKTASGSTPAKTPITENSQSQVRPVDFTKQYQAAVDRVKAQIKLFSGTKAGLLSALNLSSFLIQQKQYAQALEVLEIPTYRPASAELLAGFWWMHRGLVFVENSKIDQAIESYKAVTASEALKAFQPEALLKLGLCYELKGDAGQARATYERIGRDFPRSEASSTALQYLRLLELNAHKQG